MLWGILGLVIGFIAGALVYRNNKKKLEQYIKDWDLESLSEIKKKLDFE